MSNFDIPLEAKSEILRRMALYQPLGPGNDYEAAMNALMRVCLDCMVEECKHKADASRLAEAWHKEWKIHHHECCDCQEVECACSYPVPTALADYYESQRLHREGR